MHSFSLRHQGDVLTDQVDGEAAAAVGAGTEEEEAAEVDRGVSSRGGAGVEGQSVAREAATGGQASASASASASAPAHAFTPAPAAAPAHAAAAPPPPAMGADAIGTNPKEVPEYSYVLEDDLTNPASGLAALGNGALIGLTVHGLSLWCGCRC